MTAPAVRILIVDDSALLRRALAATFTSCGFTVVGEAATGADAIAQTAALRPDLITMDLDMPDMDGLAAIEQIMAERPTPILVVTGEPRFRGLDAQFEALTRGAIELVPKPSSFPVAGDELRLLVDVARLAASIAVVPHVRAHGRRRREQGSQPPPIGQIPSVPGRRIAGWATGGVVVVGASTGGPGALRDLLRSLPARPSAPIVIVQHMAEPFGEGFVRWLSSCVPIGVEEARAGERLRPGHVYVAARGAHVRVAPDATLQTSWSPEGRHRPAVDELFRSAAEAYGARSLGVLLTGMGDDGAAGLAEIFGAGGLTAAQDEASSTVFGMPRAAIERGAVRVVAPPSGLARLIHEATLAPVSAQTRGIDVD